MNETAVKKFVYWAKNIKARPFLAALARYAKGDVVDVGGRDFFLVARKNPRIAFNSWTNLEKDAVLRGGAISDARYTECVGDGCAMPFKNNSFDAVINSLVRGSCRGAKLSSGGSEEGNIALTEETPHVRKE